MGLGSASVMAKELGKIGAGERVGSYVVREDGGKGEHDVGSS